MHSQVIEMADNPIKERLQNTRPTLKGTSFLLLWFRSDQTKFMQLSELKDCYRSAAANKVEVS